MTETMGHSKIISYIFEERKFFIFRPSLFYAPFEGVTVRMFYVILDLVEMKQR